MPLRRPKPRPLPPRPWIALAGLETGVFAGIVALAYLILDGIMRGDGPWRVLNLIAAGYFRETAFSLAASRATLAGFAVGLIAAGVVGAGLAFLLTPAWNRPLLRRLLGITLGAVWYYLSFRFLWPSANPALVLYQPFPSMLVAHLTYGFVMALIPRIVEDLGPLDPRAAPAPFV